jgi:hypothetical protein
MFYKFSAIVSMANAITESRKEIHYCDHAYEVLGSTEVFRLT